MPKSQKEQYEDQWEEKFLKLQQFYKDHGHSKVTRNDDKSLNKWVKDQRMYWKEGRLKPDRLEKLKTVEFIFQFPEGTPGVNIKTKTNRVASTEKRDREDQCNRRPKKKEEEEEEEEEVEKAAVAAAGAAPNDSRSGQAGLSSDQNSNGRNVTQVAQKTGSIERQQQQVAPTTSLMVTIIEGHQTTVGALQKAYEAHQAAVGTLQTSLLQHVNTVEQAQTSLLQHVNTVEQAQNNNQMLESTNSAFMSSIINSTNNNIVQAIINHQAQVNSSCELLISNARMFLGVGDSNNTNIPSEINIPQSDDVSNLGPNQRDVVCHTFNGENEMQPPPHHPPPTVDSSRSNKKPKIEHQQEEVDREL